MGWLLLIAFGLGIAMVRAKVILVLYGWFLLPLDFPEISFGVMLGVMYMWSVLNHPSWEDMKEHELSEVFMLGFVSLFHVGMTLLICWLIKMAMMTGG